MRGLQILYVFVLREEVLTTFGSIANIYTGCPKKNGTRIINYVFAEIIIHNNVIIIDNSLLNLTFRASGISYCLYSISQSKTS